MADIEAKPYPFDVLALKKGDWIPPEKCEAVLGIRRDSKRYPLRLLALKQMLERQWDRERDGETITTAAEKDGIRICSDDGAVVVNQRRSNQRIHGLRRDLTRLNGIDRSQLSSAEVRATHEKTLTRLSAFVSGGYQAARAALRGHSRSTPGLPGGSGDK